MEENNHMENEQVKESVENSNENNQENEAPFWAKALGCLLQLIWFLFVLFVCAGIRTCLRG